mgnify:CR=1 FL=1
MYLLRGRCQRERREIVTNEYARPGDVLGLSYAAVVALLAPDDPRTLILCQELDFFGKIGDSPEGDKSSGHREESFQDLVLCVSEQAGEEDEDRTHKDPPPSRVASNAVHFANCVGEDPRERSGESRSGEEEGDAELVEMARVPAANAQVSYVTSLWIGRRSRTYMER